MSWLISKALYEKWHCSQEPVEESSEATCSDGEQSALLNGNHTQLAYLPPDKMTAFCRLSRFGMTFKPLTADRGEDLLMWFRGDFLAKTYPAQEKELESTEQDQECGVKWLELSARYDLDSCSWRTHLCLWDEALPWSSVTLPRWGMTVSGVLFQHPTAERPISETGSGLWLGTPTASMTQRSEKFAEGRLPTPREFAQTWATPTTMDKLPPKSANLRDQVSNMKQWPTPTAHNAKETNAPSEANRNEPTLASRVGGKLNPMWVEKLMGWPEDWSSINPISHIKMMFWLMGFEHDSERCVNQVLRILQSGNVQKEIREATGRFFNISEAAFLLSQLCEYSDRPDEARVFMESKKAFEKQMRGLRVSEETSSASYRPEQQEQRAEEYSDALQALSRFLAHYGKEAWQNGSWEDAVPRVENNVAARMDRLKAIGNGQVPVVAATAFNILKL
jgi:hypothetical protein